MTAPLADSPARHGRLTNQRIALRLYKRQLMGRMITHRSERSYGKSPVLESPLLARLSQQLLPLTNTRANMASWLAASLYVRLGASASRARDTPVGAAAR
jgi:hypothetical protein